jgi:hypothetical protein
MCKYIDDLKENGYKKNSVKKIAKKYKIPESRLLKYYQSKFFSNISQAINLPELVNVNLNTIEEELTSEELKKEFRFIKIDLQKIIQKSLSIAMTNGFPININNIESGLMTSNAGDSAEFIFVARAILAGFNCSSVDVRSSKYDAIIDYNNKLLRVQIKGISAGNYISFKDRDRGGQGVDHRHERNIGQRITSEECDIYVAVDKQVGICYIIPMVWCDMLSYDECKSVKLDKVLEYKENWNIIKDLTI